ncbi:hypothetical protein [Deefgea sp. CFH1-16]|uniref:hypothetical protein n=1 Tax=Deefgea sp. CFH1-16 TaxID=2675457 RepID=UPI0015F75858|nr:hypothetical protein [Deefgea sp. CFH1-16]MBM5573691.1 hypothetical protein [Deefgea sp. CFH1-16]
MSRYRQVKTSIWSDTKFRSLSAMQPSGQALWLYLLTGPHTKIIPGLFRLGRAALAEELNWDLADLDRVLAELIEQGMVKVDFDVRLVWLPNAIKHNAPANPNVIIGWTSDIGELPECALKTEALQHFEQFIQTLGGSASAQKTFLTAFYRAVNPLSTKLNTNGSRNGSRNGSGNGLGNGLGNGSSNGFDNGLPNQEQEQQQETYQEHDSAAPTERKRSSQQKVNFDMGTGKFSDISDAQLETWTKAHPTVDIEKEMAKAAAWLIANPSKKKSNYASFLTNWFSRVLELTPAKSKVKTGNHDNFSSQNYGQGGLL